MLVGGFNDSIWLMDRKGIILKKLITFSDVFLLNNFDISSNSLDVIADNKLITFSVLKPKVDLIYSKNWVIKSSSISQLEFFNISKMVESKSSSTLQNDLFGSSFGQLNDLLKGSCSNTNLHNHYSLENLGIIKSISIYNDENIAILCRTDKSFRVLVLRLSEIDHLITQNRKLLSKQKNEWLNNDEYDNSDEDSDEESEMNNKKIDLYQLIKYYKGNELRDIKRILSLGDSFLAIYGKVVKLLDENLKVLKTWIMHSSVECIKELITHPGAEVVF